MPESQRANSSSGTHPAAVALKSFSHVKLGRLKERGTHTSGTGAQVMMMAMERTPRKVGQPPGARAKVTGKRRGKCDIGTPSSRRVQGSTYLTTKRNKNKPLPNTKAEKRLALMPTFFQPNNLACQMPSKNLCNIDSPKTTLIVRKLRDKER